MNTPKEAVAEIICDLPDDATYEDIMYRLYVRAKVEHAMKEADEGNLIDQEDAEKIMSKWIIEGRDNLDTGSNKDIQD